MLRFSTYDMCPITPTQVLLLTKYRYSLFAFVALWQFMAIKDLKKTFDLNTTISPKLQ